jgi:hypothetical protein
MKNVLDKILLLLYKILHLLNINLNPMKKITFSIAIAGLLITQNLFAQRTAVTHEFVKRDISLVKMNQNQRGLGDTLFLFDGRDFYITDPNDMADFDLKNFDGDGKSPDPSIGWPQGGESFVFSFITLNPYYFTPNWDTDTAFYIGATSWFSPVGKADNWWSFGPVTIPAGGADLSWFHRAPDREYSDGYRVFISTSGVTPYSDVDPDVDTPIFVKNDCSNCPLDTAFVKKTVNIDQYANQRVWIHYQHNANDKFILYLDHMLITEKNNVGIASKNNNIIEFGNYPNPAKNNTVVTYGLTEASNVELKVFNVAGKEIMVINEGVRSAGNYSLNLNTTSLPSGIYFYTLVTDKGNETRKMTVIK